MQANVYPLDRFVRALFGIFAALLAWFWLPTPWSWLAWVAAAVLIGTALLRFCPLYLPFGFGRGAAKGGGPRPVWMIAALLVLAAVLAGGSYASNFFSRKIFLEEFNAMNHFYKQTLFLTGKAQRAEALDNYTKLVPAYAAFKDKYTRYRPQALAGDGKLQGDLDTVARMIAAVEPGVRTGDLHQTHLDLEKIRPVFQEMFKRNGFSMLAIALVDFHDAMELMLDAATAKDAAKLVSLYPSVSEKMAAVEADTNDAEIQAIRKNLDTLLATAKEARLDALPAQGDALKTSFVKVYLKRG